MKIFVYLFICLISFELLHSQPRISSGTGIIGFNLDSYGKISTGSYPYSTTNREIDRMTLFVGQSTTSVYDYYYDADSTIFTARKIIIAGADSAVEVLSDNGYSNLPPKIKVRTTIVGWKNQNFIIIRYRIIADTNLLGSLYYGTAIIPRIGTLIGFETIKYNGTKKVTYFYRDGTPSFWGIKLLNQNPYGVSILDWNKYSTNPNIEPVNDSIKFAMVSKNQIDTQLVAGSNGSIFSMNAGTSSFANKGDSITIYYALGFGTTDKEMYASLDSATVKFPKIVTAIHFENNFLQSFSLSQNYPNPFNPTTIINYHLPMNSFTTVKIFDIVGREVATLINEMKNAGNHSIQFDATHLPAGVYFYQIKSHQTEGGRAGDFVQTKKMIVVK